VKNAREATSGGGTVALILDTEEVLLRTAQVPAGSYARIRVVDTGTGMVPEVQRRAFEPFFSTKTGVHGAGLGLALAAGFVRKHQGHIDMESRAGQGTCVTLHFPLHFPLHAD
jgi:signal transduction histidine kinase